MIIFISVCKLMRMQQITGNMIPNQKTPMAKFLTVLDKVGLFSLPGVVMYPLLSIGILLAPMIYMTIHFGSAAILGGNISISI